MEFTKVFSSITYTFKSFGCTLTCKNDYNLNATYKLRYNNGIWEQELAVQDPAVWVKIDPCFQDWLNECMGYDPCVKSKIVMSRPNAPWR